MPRLGSKPIMDQCLHIDHLIMSACVLYWHLNIRGGCVCALIGGRSDSSLVLVCTLSLACLNGYSGYPWDLYQFNISSISTSFGPGEVSNNQPFHNVGWMKAGGGNGINVSFLINARFYGSIFQSHHDVQETLGKGRGLCKRMSLCLVISACRSCL